MKTIEVFVDATPESEKRVDYAAALAREFGAHLAGIHVASAVRPEHRSDHYVVGEKAIRASRAWQKEADEIAVTIVRRRFEAISTKSDLRAEFRVIRPGGPDEDLIPGSLHSDLVVVGQRELQEMPTTYPFPEKLLLGSGVPILVVPSGWKSEPIGKKILVGWNASREARHALADALPFLVKAVSVRLLVVASNERAAYHDEEPGADIAMYLARRGVRVDAVQVSSRASPVADIILSHAADHRVDLIVIGGYSHARSVEMLFSGVPRTLLGHSPIPVLLSR